MNMTPVKFSELLQDRYRAHWQDIIQKSDVNHSKLDVYSLFKKSFEYEPYLDYVGDRHKTSMITKFRISNHRLRVETGRHERPYVDREKKNV